MTRLFALAALFAFVASPAFVPTAHAEDEKKDDKKEVPFKGTWTKESDGVEIAFVFETKGVMKLKASAGGASMTATCKITVEKDAVKAEVTKVEEEGEFPQKPPVGYKFGFKLKAEKDAAKVSDFDADNKAEVAPIIEGDYKKTKAD